MSRAFVKETDDATDALPDRAVSTHPNYVTAEGLARIKADLDTLRTRLGEAQACGDKQALASLSRDLRYWTARRSSAELVEPKPGGEVHFGTTVTIEREDGRTQTFRIVGEDEADPRAGTLSYVAPLARALTGKAEGDEIAFMGDTIAIIRLA